MKLLSLGNLTKIIDKNVALEKYLAINNVIVLTLFIVIGATTAYLFKDRESLIEEITKKNKNRNKNFSNILFDVYFPIFVGILFNLIIKIGIFYSVSDKINGEVSPMVIIISFIYLAIISLFIGSLNILAALTLKNQIKSLIFPIFIIDSLIIVFSLMSFILGETIPAIKEAINLIFYPILKLIDGFFFNFKFELMLFQNQLAILSLLAVMTALGLLFAYKTVLMITENDMKLEVRNESIRKFILSILMGTSIFGILVVIGAFFSLLLNTVDIYTTVLAMEILSFVVIPIVYIKVNKLYGIKRNEILQVQGEGLLVLNRNSEFSIVEDVSNNLKVKNKLNKKVSKINSDNKNNILKPKLEKSGGKTDFQKIKKVKNKKSVEVKDTVKVPSFKKEKNNKNKQ